MMQHVDYIPIELFSKNKKIPELPVLCRLPPTPGPTPARTQGEGGEEGPSASWATPASLRPKPQPPALLFFLLPFSPCWACRQPDLPGPQSSKLLSPAGPPSPSSPPRSFLIPGMFLQCAAHPARCSHHTFDDNLDDNPVSAVTSHSVWLKGSGSNATCKTRCK